MTRVPDPIELCPGCRVDVQLKDLPCGGCTYCTRAHEQWGQFMEDVDDTIGLAGQGGKTFSSLIVGGGCSDKHKTQVQGLVNSVREPGKFDLLGSIPGDVGDVGT